MITVAKSDFGENIILKNESKSLQLSILGRKMPYSWGNKYSKLQKSQRFIWKKFEKFLQID